MGGEGGKPWASGFRATADGLVRKGSGGRKTKREKKARKITERREQKQSVA